MGLSSTGIGSGLDVNSIVSQLVQLERKPIEKLKTAETSIQTKISSYGKVQGMLASLRDASAALAKPGLWKQSTASSSDAAAVSIETTGTVAAGNYAVSVTKLAQPHLLYSDFVSADPGAGSLTIGSGSKSATLTFTDPATTVDQVRDAINAAGAGVTAAVVKDAGGNARLSLTAQGTGNANQISVSATGAGYAGFAFDPSNPTASPGMTQAQAAQDAQLTINGVPVSSSSNVVTTAIEGLSLTLSKETSSPVKLNVATDTAAQRKAMEDFVSAYNALNSYAAEQTKYDTATKTAAPLQGDSTLLNVQRQLRNVMHQNAGVSTVFTNLSSVGIEFQSDGNLKLNSAKVTNALKQPEELANLFTPIATDYPVFNGLGNNLTNLVDKLKSTDGVVAARTTGLNAQLKRNQTQQSTAEERVTRVQARLEKYYQALDTKMSAITTQSAYVTQQINSWNKSSSDS